MFLSRKVLRPGPLLLVSFCAALAPLSAQSAPTSAPALEERVESLFSQLTPDEKLALLQGTGFTTAPIPRLHIPVMGMVDAGQGVRGGVDGTQGPATLFPSGVAMAATWDPELVGRIGKAIGTEALNKGTGAQILLGPAVNIDRSPLGGRNGEYFSEDPYLASRLAVGYIEGLQSSGASSRDIRQTIPLTLTATFTEAIPFMAAEAPPNNQRLGCSSSFQEEAWGNEESPEKLAADGKAIGLAFGIEEGCAICTPRSTSSL